MSNLNFDRRRVKVGARRPKSQHGKCNDNSVRKKARPGTAPSRIKQRQTFYNIHEFEKTEEARDDDAYSIFSDSMASEKTVVRDNFISSTPISTQSINRKQKRYREPPKDIDIVKYIISQQNGLDSVDFDKYHHLINIRTLNATCGALKHELVHVSFENYQGLQRTEI